LGPDEVINQSVTVKQMQSGNQETIQREQLIDFLRQTLADLL
jgi:histidyl-tRNA synthetase